MEVREVAVTDVPVVGVEVGVVVVVGVVLGSVVGTAHGPASMQRIVLAGRAPEGAGRRQTHRHTPAALRACGSCADMPPIGRASTGGGPFAQQVGSCSGETLHPQLNDHRQCGQEGEGRALLHVHLDRPGRLPPAVPPDCFKWHVL